MRQATLPIPELGIIAATRGIGGAGIGLLLAHKLSDRRRRAIGTALLLVGAVSTIPLAIDVFRKSKSA